MAIIASFVIGANGATTRGGDSRGLSTSADRERFLKRHRSASAFIIGKNSAQSESYEKSQVPIFVLSRSSSPLQLSDPKMKQIVVEKSLDVTVREIASRFDGNLVVEAGISLLLALIESGAIDILELTLSPIDGDGNFTDPSKLQEKFETISAIEIEGTKLLECRYKGDTSYR